ncbi:aminomethyl-transferring glycine dehydrogenase subunit GcvPA [Candidatus Bathyarchaeota archaeon]|nr:aminomethyl-transferring glycine dehydrogenase subunit GcvPA [Candidatus Bathyarchaeota archaeon]MBL7079233.1 aminomethyl-transferring glycine dehydrogenase subunit GcvPA [Candidatus Bathyarchaeota archaeon]
MNKPHPYMPNSVPDIKEKMIEEMGIKSIDDLYVDIPVGLRFERELDVPGPFTEAEVKKHVSGLLERNWGFAAPPFLGGGVWPHYVPAVVDEIVHRAEFLTSYTPYQPEISQGILQSIFEYQSLICELVGMDVANASMYDWATALGEASRMACRLTRRSRVLVPSIISPRRLSVLRSYTEPVDIEITQVDYDKTSGQLDLEDLKEKIGSDSASVYIENPSYLGFVEEGVEAIAEIAHDSKALFVVGVDPISLGLIKPPGEYGADIVIGEGQPLGNHMNFGGPLLGMFACKSDTKVIRQMPGRLIGVTQTLEDDRRAFTMTLQTREQHIRREKATSNICSNQALNALASAVYLSLMGPQGIKDLSELVSGRAHYAIRRLGELPGVRAPVFSSFHFKEFTVQFRDKTVEEVNQSLLDNRLHGGKSIVGEFPDLGETALFCVTESHTKEDIDRLAYALEEALEG